jgi:hypothetical protein
MEPLPDLQSLSDAELRDLIRELMEEKQQVGEGTSPLTEVDIDRLTEILAAKAAPPVEDEQ